MPSKPSSETEESPIHFEPKDVPPPLPGQKGEVGVRSLERHACPNCGGKAIWNPSIQKLECPYCATTFERDSQTDDDDIIEHDLLQTLAELGATPKDWDEPETRLVKCSNCHATLRRNRNDVAQNCDFCGAPELLDYEDIDAVIRPESILPAKVDKNSAAERLKLWLGKRWLAPNDLKKRSLIDRLHGVYIPYWTFDANAHCPWTAQSGTYYYVTRTYTDSNGKTRTRQERRTRWRPASGTVNTAFDDVTISGSRSVENKLQREIEPYPTGELTPYETRYVSGWHVEQYQVDLPQAAQLGKSQMHQMLREMCADQIPGDTYRNLQINPQYSDQTFKHILVPIWIVAYQYRSKTYQSVVNGFTGKVASTYPKSIWKITFLVLLAILIIGSIIYLNR